MAEGVNLFQVRFTSCARCGADIELELVHHQRPAYWIWVCRGGPDVFLCDDEENHEPDWSDQEWLTWWLDVYEVVAA